MNEKERKKIREELRKRGNDFLGTLRDEVDSAVFLCDVDRLGRLVSAVHNHMDAEVVRAIREKGFDKELRELCDRVGRGRKRNESEKME